VIGTLLGLLLACLPAQAGLLDSPPPSFDSGAGQVVYRMGPIYYEAGHVDTLVTCTNLSDAPVSMAVEIFDEEDARVRLTRGTAAPRAELTFATSSAPGVAGAVVVSELPRLDHGKARVSATSKSISCSAKHRTVTAEGAVSEGQLELVKKVAF
jgi:hypothetical protein